MEYVMIPAEWMDHINTQLDRIERAVQRHDIPVMGNVYSVKAVAEKLGVSEMTIYRWVREKRLRGVHTGGRILIPGTAVDEFLRGGDDEHHGGDEA